jgi:hypothetical protein
MSAITRERIYSLIEETGAKNAPELDEILRLREIPYNYSDLSMVFWQLQEQAIASVNEDTSRKVLLEKEPAKASVKEELLAKLELKKLLELQKLQELLEKRFKKPLKNFLKNPLEEDNPIRKKYEKYSPSFIISLCKYGKLVAPPEVVELATLCNKTFVADEASRADLYNPYEFVDPEHRKRLAKTSYESEMIMKLLGLETKEDLTLYILGYAEEKKK